MSGFDPGKFFALARTVGHGRALGLDYREHGEDWVELAPPRAPQRVSLPEPGGLAAGPRPGRSARVVGSAPCPGPPSLSAWPPRGSWRRAPSSAWSIPARVRRCG